jgi:hypothetical protein
VVVAETKASLAGTSSIPRLFIPCQQFRSLVDTVGQTTKSVPVVGGVTDPVLKTVGGVTEGLPIVRKLSRL